MIPKVGPSSDGQVVLEWELASGRSVYCRISEAIVEVSGFDEKADLVDLKLPPDPAAHIVKVLLEHL